MAGEVPASSVLDELLFSAARPTPPGSAAAVATKWNAPREADTGEMFRLCFEGIATMAFENGRLSERVRHEANVRQNLERYFTPRVAQAIAASQDVVRPGGDKRAVAVLFSDIRGFTSLAERTNPYAMAQQLTEYFSEMVDCVYCHGGTVDKFMGDAVMAQWGAPVRSPDDPDQALAAARDMQKRLESLNVRWTVAGRPTLEVGIGINFGIAFAGNIGCDQRLEYTVIGDTVNTACRICAAAGPGEILLSDECWRALTDRPPVVALPALELKGKSQPVSVYRLER